MIFYGATDKGVVRSNNEDDFISQFVWDDRHVLCVVIDGLGGYEGGEVASSIAHETIVSFLNEHRMGDCLDLLKQAVTQANNNIVGRQLEMPGLNRMGCVITAGLFELEQGRLNVAHVGDSRLYQYHDRILRKLTHDHSLVGYREDNGELTEEQAMNHPQRNIVERVLGDKIHQLDDKNFIEAAIFPLVPGAHYIFCSDGLSDMLTSAEIAAIVERQKDNLQGCVKGLINSACDHGGNDNVTVVIARYLDDASRRGASLPPSTARPKGPKAPEDDSFPKVKDKPMSDEHPLPPVAANESTHDQSDEEQDQHRPRRRCSFWAALAWILLALAACAAAFYGGYYYHGLEKSRRHAAVVQSKDSTIAVLQDSIDHLHQHVYDQNVVIDSLTNTKKR